MRLICRVAFNEMYTNVKASFMLAFLFGIFRRFLFITTANNCSSLPAQMSLS